MIYVFNILYFTRKKSYCCDKIYSTIFYGSLYIYKPKIYLKQYKSSAIVIGGSEDKLLHRWSFEPDTLHKAVGRGGHEDTLLTHFCILCGYQFFLIDAFSHLLRLIS